MNIIKGWYFKIFNKKVFLANTRLSICKDCSHKTKTTLGECCSLCGCILDAKTRVENEHCDINKW